MAKTRQEEIIMGRQYAESEQDGNEATADVFVLLFQLLIEGGDKQKLVS